MHLLLTPRLAILNKGPQSTCPVTGTIRALRALRALRSTYASPFAATSRLLKPKLHAFHTRSARQPLLSLILHFRTVFHTHSSLSANVVDRLCLSVSLSSGQLPARLVLTV